MITTWDELSREAEGVLSMRIVYDASMDVLDIYLSGGTRITSREIVPRVIADLDKDGNILSLEILDASGRYSKEDLAKLSFERIPA